MSGTSTKHGSLLFSDIVGSTRDPSRGQSVIEQGIELDQRLPTPPVLWPLILQM